MTSSEWQAFCTFRNDFKAICQTWMQQCGYVYAAPTEASSPQFCAQPIQPWMQTTPSCDQTAQHHIVSGSTTGMPLHLLQAEAAKADGTPSYPVETPIVYNHSLDEVQAADDIKLIIISDNPGKNEQLHTNQRYLVGQAGKVAEGFFRKNPDLGIDFRQNVIILNKTPVHTAKTKELKFVLDNAGTSFCALFEETQRWLAARTATLQQALQCPLWLVGYGELRKKSLFTPYAEELKRQYNSNAEAPVFVFQHFSMNCFAIDLKKQSDPTVSIAENLQTIGLRHRHEVLGW